MLLYGLAVFLKNIASAFRNPCLLMELGPSWKALSLSVGQEVPCLPWKLRFLPCGMYSPHCHEREGCCLLRNEVIDRKDQSSLKMETEISPKRWCLSLRLYGVLSRKTGFISVTGFTDAYPDRVDTLTYYPHKNHFNIILTYSKATQWLGRTVYRGRSVVHLGMHWVSVYHG
jgi:hypothetical protein